MNQEKERKDEAIGKGELGKKEGEADTRCLGQGVRVQQERLTHT